MKEQLTERVSFEFIRYANCWEDADILLEGLNPSKNSRILSIGSAGDNSFSLLITDPEIVVAVDVNAIQLYLIELKKACIKHFTRDETLSFLGFKDSSLRKQQFEFIHHELSTEASIYWSVNFDLIEKGLIHQGKFEKYFQLFCKRILPLIHNKKNISTLFHHKTEEQQLHFYKKHWNTWRWRLLFKLFFSKRVMGKYGRDPEFLKEVNVKVSDYIFKKAELQLQSTRAQRNFILQYNLTSSFGNNLPHYLREENYDIIKNNIHKLVMFKGYAEEAFAQYGKFDYMNLSNIFEYLDHKTFTQVAEGLVKGSNNNAKLAYWNLMVPRRISEIMSSEVSYQQEASQRLSAKDKGFFYSKFIIDQVSKN